MDSESFKCRMHLAVNYPRHHSRLFATADRLLNEPCTRAPAQPNVKVNARASQRRGGQ